MTLKDTTTEMNPVLQRIMHSVIEFTPGELLDYYRDFFVLLHSKESSDEDKALREAAPWVVGVQVEDAGFEDVPEDMRLRALLTNLDFSRFLMDELRDQAIANVTSGAPAHTDASLPQVNVDQINAVLMPMVKALFDFAGVGMAIYLEPQSMLRRNYIWIRCPSTGGWTIIHMELITKEAAEAYTEIQDTSAPRH